MSSTFVISLQTLLEQAQADTQVFRQITGNIVGDIDSLFSVKNIEALRQSFQGTFAFLGFQPEVDTGITSYVLSGSLGSDSGHHILVLFALGTPATSPTLLKDQSLRNWLIIGNDVHPSYTVIRSMFKDSVALRFPGIILFEDPLQEQNPVYVPISNATDENAVRMQMRQIFALAEKAFQDALIGRASFLDLMALAFQKEHVDYERGQDISAREWLINAFRFIHERLGDIVSIVSLFK